MYLYIFVCAPAGKKELVLASCTFFCCLCLSVFPPPPPSPPPLSLSLSLSLSLMLKHMCRNVRNEIEYANMFDRYTCRYTYIHVILLILKPRLDSPAQHVFDIGNLWLYSVMDIYYIFVASSFYCYIIYIYIIYIHQPLAVCHLSWGITCSIMSVLGEKVRDSGIGPKIKLPNWLHVSSLSSSLFLLCVLFLLLPSLLLLLRFLLLLSSSFSSSSSFLILLLLYHPYCHILAMSTIRN